MTETAKIAETRPDSFTLREAAVNLADPDMRVVRYSDYATLQAQLADKTRELDEARGELPSYWADVIGGEYKPAVLSGTGIRHIHPKVVKPIFEKHLGTEVADVIAGLIFAQQVAANRAYFGLQLANDERARAEAAEAEVARQKQAVADAEKRLTRYENWLPISVTPASRHVPENALLHFYMPEDGEDETEAWWSGTWDERPDNATMWCLIVSPLGPSTAALRARREATDAR